MLFLLMRIKLVADNIEVHPQDEDLEFDLLSNGYENFNSKAEKYQRIIKLKDQLQLIKQAILKIMTERLNLQLLILDQSDEYLIKLFCEIIKMTQRFDEIKQRGKMYTEELDNLYLATKSIEEKAEKMGSKLRKNLELRNQKAHDLEMLNEEMLGIQLMIDEMQSDLNATKERNNELSEELLEDQQRIKTLEEQKSKQEALIEQASAQVCQEDANYLDQHAAHLKNKISTQLEILASLKEPIANAERESSSCNTLYTKLEQHFMDLQVVTNLSQECQDLEKKMVLINQENEAEYFQGFEISDNCEEILKSESRKLFEDLESLKGQNMSLSLKLEQVIEEQNFLKSKSATFVRMLERECSEIEEKKMLLQSAYESEVSKRTDILNLNPRVKKIIAMKTQMTQDFQAKSLSKYINQQDKKVIKVNLSKTPSPRTSSAS